jgi:hypothetical protein
VVGAHGVLHIMSFALVHSFCKHPLHFIFHRVSLSGPMVTPTKENTTLISDMGGVSSSGMMDESTMECIVTTRDMEGYVLVVKYSLLGPFKKMIKKHLK